MKSKILRICISFLTVLMVFISLHVMNASAGESFIFDGIVHEISGGEVTITDYWGDAENLTIPSSFDGYPVTSIGDRAFYSCDSLTSIEIPESVTSIGEGAFYSCNSLTSIEIPESVTSIGDNAFYSCDSLASITIPSSVTSIGNWAFFDCKSLTSIEIPESVTSIGDNAFSYCGSLTSIEIPEGVTSIGEYAFESCNSLTSITIPSSVTSIEEGAFSGCNSLADVYYEGSEEDWKSVLVGDYNAPLTNVKIHFNGQIESQSGAESEEKVSSGMKAIGFALIGIIVLAVVALWVFIIKKTRKV